MIRNKQLLKKKEQGYALIIVLLVITVFSILGLTVMSVSFNNTKQFSKETYKTQATNAAEMGLKKFNSAVNEIKAKNESFTEKKEEIEDLVINSNFNAQTNNQNATENKTGLQNNPSFKVSAVSIGNSDSSNIVEVKITSQGRVNGELRTIIQIRTFTHLSTPSIGDGNDDLTGAAVYGGKWKAQGNVVISGEPLHKQMNFDNIKQYFNGMELPSTSPLSNAQNETGDTNSSVHYLNDVNFTNSIWTNISQTVDFDKSVYIKGIFNGSGNIHIKGDLYVGSIANLSGNITVDGNVYVNGIANFSGRVTINGNVFINQDANLTGNIGVEGDMFVGNNFKFEGGTKTFNGFVYIGNDFYRKNDSEGWNEVLQFNKTVLVQGNTDLHSNKVEIELNNGIVANQDVSLHTSNNGKITIGNVNDWINDNSSSIDDDITSTTYN